MTRALAGGLVVTAALLAAVAGRARDDAPPGAERSTTTKALEAGAEMLQGDEPLDQISVYLVGFHPLKDDPQHQMEAHHYCNQVNEHFAQCVLFDGNTKTANLTGIEYIIAEKLFERLPLEEKRYWHPHNYEILSGQLIAPGIPAAAEHEAMERKVNSYGKTWHVWMTGMHAGKNDDLPLGGARLAWSFNRDGEDAPGLLATRDERFDVDTAAKREARQDLVGMAKPQCGVDALAGRFPRETKTIAGVAARREGCPPDEPPPASR